MPKPFNTPSRARAVNAGNATAKALGFVPQRAAYASRHPAVCTDSSVVRFGMTGYAVYKSRTECYFYPDVDKAAGELTTHAKVPLDAVYLPEPVLVTEQARRLDLRHKAQLLGQEVQLEITTGEVVARSRKIAGVWRAKLS